MATGRSRNPQPVERSEASRGTVSVSWAAHFKAAVDPFSYRKQLTQPKLIMLSTNDGYWPLDALNLYWSELPEPKRVLYVPNQGHGLRDIDRVMGAVSAAHRYT